MSANTVLWPIFLKLFIGIVQVYTGVISVFLTTQQMFLMFSAALVNANMPRTFGDGVIHMSHCDVIVTGTDELPVTHPRPATDGEEHIGRLISENLVQDGATLQMGE